jgi:hypothetical protein
MVEEEEEEKEGGGHGRLERGGGQIKLSFFESIV